MTGKVILLTGPPAVGKSTLARLCTNETAPMLHLDYGSLLVNLKRRTIPNLTRQQLRSRASALVSPKDVAEIDELVIRRVQTSRKRANVLIDNHPVTREPFGFRVTPLTVSRIKRLKLDAIVALFCPADELAARIRHHPEGRLEANTEEVAHHQELQEAAALTYSVVAGCPLFVVDAFCSPFVLLDKATRIFDDLGVKYSRRKGSPESAT